LAIKKQNINKATIIVVSSAIKKNNPELIEAKKKQLPIYKRGEMLAHIVSLTKNIVVVGSHGKTTTTSLIASIFQETKIDPTIINGGIINSINNSAKLGKSDWSILEADESDGSFVYIPPTYSIITNIDREHMDFYSSMKELNEYFFKFVKKVPSFGKSFICLDDKNNKNLIKNLKIKNFYTYGLDPKSNFCIKNIKQFREYSEFDLKIILPNKKNKLIKEIRIPLLGLHNIRNSVAAAALSITVGLTVLSIKKGLKNFKGVQRRFNKIFTYNEVDFFDDYAHHPTEIKVVLDGVSNVYNNYEKICIFQPHRISRLKDLKKEFTHAFKGADKVILLPIYTAGEKIKLGFNYLNFAKELIKNSKVKLFLVDDKYQLAKYIKNNIYGKKIVIGMGAGTISTWMRELPKLI
jgi:UDP-N-acetylmuramate--alanine ligase